MPPDTMEKLTVVGAGFGAGIAEASAYRVNRTLGTLVTFGGGIAGLLAALMLTGMLAKVGEGVAASSAGSLGHFAIKTVWPETSKRLPEGRANKAIAGGNPRSRSSVSEQVQAVASGQGPEFEDGQLIV